MALRLVSLRDGAVVLLTGTGDFGDDPRSRRFGTAIKDPARKPTEAAHRARSR
jgi:hypothetical protein